MLKSLLCKIFGSRNERLLKSYGKNVVLINALEAQMQLLSDLELKQKTNEFKQRLSSQDNDTLDTLLVEAFAVCREASRRVLNMRHFDVQLIGGMALHDGKIAEMRTGEGKTLVATLAAYLNALSGNGVHIVTVNDYLARRDATHMGQLYNFLGLTVGVITSDMYMEDKQSAYSCDITYGTNNEFGFDYLRDNMVFNLNDKVCKKLNFAIVDEVDSILIDEARTPLIISGPAEEGTNIYLKMNQIATKLKRQSAEDSLDGDFWVDEKDHNVVLSESGHIKAEELLSNAGLISSDGGLYSIGNVGLLHYLLGAIKAHYLYLKDQHYVVQNGEIVIVDEFTGRLMSGRRWSDGLHQAVEAKEKVAIQKENRTLASITFQNYFRMYNKLSGMTGTADTEAYEFEQIYSLETVVIPTNKPMVRIDRNDQIYLTVDDKYKAIIEDVKACHARSQPVLVGTTSVENSEKISSLLKKEKLPHKVLNAKQHDKEAEVIIQAGVLGAITVATNMAGRGTDIILGGNPSVQLEQAKQEPDENTKNLAIDKLQQQWQKHHEDVIALGGLHVIGTERHESRRVDNQLRGRCARQGDPGSSCFYLSLEDSLLRIFGGDRVRGIMQSLGIKSGEAIEHKWLSKSIERAQKKVEGHNFDIRKQLLEYDDVNNDQRHIIYEQRDHILAATNLDAVIDAMIADVALNVCSNCLGEHDNANESAAILSNRLLNEFNCKIDIPSSMVDNGIDISAITSYVSNAMCDMYKNKLASATEQGLISKAEFERNVLLQHIDHYYREHLTGLEHLRQGIHLLGYAQKDPKQEYKNEAFNLFAQMLEDIKYNLVKMVMMVQFVQKESTTALNDQSTGRNKLCICGSGKKYKHCCGKI